MKEIVTRKVIRIKSSIKICVTKSGKPDLEIINKPEKDTIKEIIVVVILHIHAALQLIIDPVSFVTNRVLTTS